MRLGKVYLDLTYTVDLDNPQMVERAVDALFDDICNCVKYEEVLMTIATREDEHANDSDIPEFLLDESV